jgi:peptidoglycan/LPS O-acetylase OafA/YrhL
MSGEFSVGCLLWAAHRRSTATRLNSHDFLTFIAVGGLVTTLLTLKFAGFALPFLVLLVHAIAEPGPISKWVLGHYVLQFLGRISFSLYMSHFLLVKAAVYLQTPSASGLERALMSLILYATAFALAFVLCAMIEEPMRRYGRGSTRPQPAAAE